MESRSDQPRTRGPRGPRGLRDPRAWHRDYAGRRFAGVCASLAENLEVSVSAVRLAFVLLTLFHGTGILVYAVIWALLPATPEEPAPLDRWVHGARRFLGEEEGPLHAGARRDPHYDYDPGEESEDER